MVERDAVVVVVVVEASLSSGSLQLVGILVATESLGGVELAVAEGARERTSGG